MGFLPMEAGKGSPPHTRGRSVDALDGLSNFRFTPAYAGKITDIKVTAHGHRVHPRIRGEDPMPNAPR